MERSDRPTRDKTQVTPEPSKPELFEFLEKLFDGADQKPERIELRQAYGPGARKYGAQIIQKEFKVNAVKPTREQIVALSNELLDLAQQNCNAISKPHRYGILAKHYAKSDTFYAVYVISLRPKQSAAEDYDPNGPGGEEDDDITSDGRRRDLLLQYGLEHIKQADENERWRQDQHSTSTGDIIEKYQHLVGMLMQQNLEMQKEHRELFKIADEALSRKSERELATEMQKFKIGMMQDGFQFLKQMAPVAVNQLTGKQTIPTRDSPESLAIKTFIEGLSEQQAKELFGDIVEGKLQPTGVFTEQQVMIFSGVAQCTEPPEALDKLFGGEYAVSPEQIAKAQTIISSRQFAPLFALIMGRQKKQIENTASQPQP